MLWLGGCIGLIRSDRTNKREKKGKREEKTYRLEIIKRTRTQTNKLIKPSLIALRPVDIRDTGKLIPRMRARNIAGNLEIIGGLGVRILASPLHHGGVLEAGVEDGCCAVGLFSSSVYIQTGDHTGGSRKEEGKTYNNTASSTSPSTRPHRRRRTHTACRRSSNNTSTNNDYRSRRGATCGSLLRRSLISHRCGRRVDPRRSTRVNLSSIRILMLRHSREDDTADGRNESEA